MKVKVNLREFKSFIKANIPNVIKKIEIDKHVLSLSTTNTSFHKILFDEIRKSLMEEFGVEDYKTDRFFIQTSTRASIQDLSFEEETEGINKVLEFLQFYFDKTIEKEGCDLILGTRNLTQCCNAVLKAFKEPSVVITQLKITQILQSRREVE